MELIYSRDVARCERRSKRITRYNTSREEGESGQGNTCDDSVQVAKGRQGLSYEGGLWRKVADVSRHVLGTYLGR